ncbi:hypothetical protein VCHE40_0259 [Vibrio cholerae HE-40]|nr:hypothetical protein VCHE40_0259 [Vibrio cholerae HE-40]
MLFHQHTPDEPENDFSLDHKKDKSEDILSIIKSIVFHV